MLNKVFLNIVNFQQNRDNYTLKERKKILKALQQQLNKVKNSGTLEDFIDEINS